MKLLYYTQKIARKITQILRKRALREAISCPHSDFSLVGKVTLINRNLKIGRGVLIYPDVMFYGDGPIEIGNDVSIGNGTVLYASKNAGIRIGDYTQIAAHCYIIDTEHGIKLGQVIKHQSNSSEPVVIGKDVWLGTNVTVLKGTHIEDGAVIGAKGLARGMYPKNSISVGIPAKVIKYRADD